VHRQRRAREAVITILRIRLPGVIGVVPCYILGANLDPYLVGFKAHRIKLALGIDICPPAYVLCVAAVGLIPAAAYGASRRRRIIILSASNTPVSIVSRRLFTAGYCHPISIPLGYIKIVGLREVSIFPQHPEPHVLNLLIVLCHATKPYGAVQQAFRLRLGAVRVVDADNLRPVARGPYPVFKDIVSDIARHVFYKHVHGNQPDFFIAVNLLGVIGGFGVIQARECQVRYVFGACIRSCNLGRRIISKSNVTVAAPAYRRIVKLRNTAGPCYLHIVFGCRVAKEQTGLRNNDPPGKGSFLYLHDG